MNFLTLDEQKERQRQTYGDVAPYYDTYKPPMSAITPELTQEYEQAKQNSPFQQTQGTLENLMRDGKKENLRRIENEERQFKRGATDEEIKTAYDTYAKLEKQNRGDALEFAASRPQIFGQQAIDKYNAYHNYNDYILGRQGDKEIEGFPQYRDHPLYKKGAFRNNSVKTGREEFQEKYNMTPEEMRNYVSETQADMADMNSWERDRYLAENGYGEDRFEAQRNILGRKGNWAQNFAAGALKSIPGAELNESLKEYTMDNAGIAQTVGEVGGTIGQILTGGGIAAQAFKAIPNAAARGAISRGVIGGFANAAQNADNVIVGEMTKNEAIRDAALTGVAGAISIIPEIAAAPKVINQIAAQTITDGLTGVAMEAVQGEKIDLKSPQFWQNVALNAAVSLGFTARDVKNIIKKTPVGKSIFEVEQDAQIESLPQKLRPKHYSVREEQILKQGKVIKRDYPEDTDIYNLDKIETPRLDNSEKTDAERIPEVRETINDMETDNIMSKKNVDPLVSEAIEKIETENSQIQAKLDELETEGQFRILTPEENSAKRDMKNDIADNNKEIERLYREDKETQRDLYSEKIREITNKNVLTKEDMAQIRELRAKHGEIKEFLEKERQKAAEEENARRETQIERVKEEMKENRELLEVTREFNPEKADIYENKIIDLKKELQKLEQNERLEYRQTFEAAKKEDTQNNTFENLPAAKGKETTIKNTDTKDEIPLKYAFIDLDNVISSHSIDGKRNPKYNYEYQPRDRGGDALIQTMDIAKNLIPSKLAESSDLTTGSPVINSKGMVLSGNGRTQALEFARKYAQTEGRTEWREYRNFLKQNAQTWGLKPQDVRDNTILVRIAPDEYGAQIAQSGNISVIRGMKPSEQAAQDFMALSKKEYVFDNIDDFTKKLFNELPNNEKQTAVGKNEKGNHDFTSAFKERANNALIRYAFGKNLSERLADTRQKDIIILRDAILKSATDMANARTKTGENKIFDDIESGIMRYLDARLTDSEGDFQTSHIDMFVEDDNIAKNIALFLYNNNKKEENLKNAFKQISRHLSAKGDRKQNESMFGNDYKENDEEVITGILKEIDSKNEYNEPVSNNKQPRDYPENENKPRPVGNSDKSDESKLSVKQEHINKKFNEELKNLNEKNADEKIFNLGEPSKILLDVGIENKPMKLYGNKILSKAKKHGFEPIELKNLPEKVNAPIAIFEGIRPDSYAILTEIVIKDNNTLVILEVGKGKDIEANIVTSIHQRNNEVFNRWMEDGKALYKNEIKISSLFKPDRSLISASLNNKEITNVRNDNIIKNDDESQEKIEKKKKYNFLGEELKGRDIPEDAKHTATIGGIEFYFRNAGKFTTRYAKTDGKVYEMSKENYEKLTMYLHNDKRRLEDGYIKGERKLDAFNKKIYGGLNENITPDKEAGNETDAQRASRIKQGGAEYEYDYLKHIPNEIREIRNGVAITEKTYNKTQEEVVDAYIEGTRVGRANKQKGLEYLAAKMETTKSDIINFLNSATNKKWQEGMPADVRAWNKMLSIKNAIEGTREQSGIKNWTGDDDLKYYHGKQKENPDRQKLDLLQENKGLKQEEIFDFARKMSKRMTVGQTIGDSYYSKRENFIKAASNNLTELGVKILHETGHADVNNYKDTADAIARFDFDNLSGKEIEELLLNRIHTREQFGGKISDADLSRSLQNREELYADFVARLFTDPKGAMSDAPTFYKRFIDDIKENGHKEFEYYLDVISGKVSEEDRYKLLFDELSKEMAQVNIDLVRGQKKRERTPLGRILKEKGERMEQIISDRFAPLKKELNKTLEGGDGRNNPVEKNLKKAIFDYEKRQTLMTKYVNDYILSLKEMTQAKIKPEDISQFILSKSVLADGKGILNPTGLTKEGAQQYLKIIEKNYSQDQKKLLENFAEKIQEQNLELMYDLKKIPERYRKADLRDVNENFPLFMQQVDGKFLNFAVANLQRYVKYFDEAKTSVLKPEILNYYFNRKDRAGLFPAGDGRRDGIRVREINESPKTGEELIIRRGVEYIVPRKITAMYKIGDVNAFFKDTYDPIINGFKKIFTTYNPIFWRNNIIRDVNSTAAHFGDNLGKTKMWAETAQFLGEMSAHKAKGDLKEFLGKEIEPIIKHSLRSEFAEIGMDNRRLADIIEKLNWAVGVSVKEKNILKKIGNVAKKPFNKMEDWSQGFDDFSKIIALRYIKKYHKDWSQERTLNFVREFAGSPNYEIKGSGAIVLNRMFMFFNPTIRSYAADIDAFKDNWKHATAKGDNLRKAELIWAAGWRVFPDALFKCALLSGFLGEELKKEAEKINDRDFAIRTVIPTFKYDKEGNMKWAVFVRNQFDGGLSAVIFEALNKQAKFNERNYSEWSQDKWAAIMSGFAFENNIDHTPLIEEYMNAVDLLKGVNPFDNFRNRSVIPERIHKAQDNLAIAGEYGKHLLRNYTPLKLPYGRNFLREDETVLSNLAKETTGKLSPLRIYDNYEQKDRIKADKEERLKENRARNKQVKSLEDIVKNGGRVAELTPEKITKYLMEFDKSGARREEKHIESAMNDLKSLLKDRIPKGNKGDNRLELPTLEEVLEEYERFNNTKLNYIFDEDGKVKVGKKGNPIRNFTPRSYAAKIYEIYFAINENDYKKQIKVEDLADLIRNDTIKID